MAGILIAACVVAERRPSPKGDASYTAIDKRPVAGPVAVRVLGLDGDSQGDTAHHGGPDQAVYAYAQEDADAWAGMLGRDVPAGSFGENLRVSGVDVNGAEIGERWRVGAGTGSALLEVTAPRTPCVTFQAWTDEPHWVRRFAEEGRPGAYLRVLEEGVVRAGDTLTVEHRPGHGVTVSATSGAVDVDTLRRLRDIERTGVRLHRDFDRLLRRADRVLG